MKKILLSFLLAIISVGAAYADELNSEQTQMRQQIFDYMRTQGYSPSISTDGDIDFTYDGLHYCVNIYGVDIHPMYLSLTLSFRYSDNFTKDAIVKYANDISFYKSVKVLPFETGYDFVSDMYLPDAATFTSVFTKMLSQINSANGKLRELVGNTSNNSTKSTTATYLTVDQKTALTKNYGSAAGSETFYVSTDASSWTTWGIPTWCTVTNVTSNSFRLNYQANTSSTMRSDFMKIQAGGKEVRIDIKQNGASSIGTYLTVDQKTALSKTYGSAAGSETFYVSTDASSWNTWGIPSWCTVTNVTSTSFRLNYSANTSSTSRSDYMKIKTGNREVRIDIKQNGASASSNRTAKVEQITVDHNVYEGGVKGMRIHVKFTVDNMYQLKGRCVAYFHFSDGRALNDYNQRYYTTDGKVSLGGDFTPNYVNCRFNDYQLFMPYDELHMSSGNYDLKFNVIIFDNNRKQLTESDWVHFTFSK